MKSHGLAAFASLSLTVTGGGLAANPPAASDLDWISGHWCSGSEQERIEEHWLPARGGMLLGVSRTTKGERTASFEFMRIAGTDAGLAFIAQPNGSSPVTFRWTAGGADWARFENPAHDFPKLVEYGRSGAKLRARIAGPGKDGKQTTISFEYEQCPAGPPVAASAAAAPRAAASPAFASPVAESRAAATLAAAPPGAARPADA